MSGPMSYAESTISEMVLRQKVEAQDIRKQEQQKAWDYYIGAGMEYTREALKVLFTEWNKYRVVPINVVRTLVDERAMLYKHAAERYLVGADGERIEEGQDLERAQEMWDQCMMDARMKSIERYTLLQRTILVKPTWRAGDDYGPKGQMELDVLGAHVTDVIQREDDPTRMDAFMYSTSYVDTASSDVAKSQLYYVYWDAKTNMKFTADGKRVTNPENKDGVNPYGIIPAVTFRDWFAEDRFWLPANRELVECNEMINLALTDIFHGLRFQTWGVPVAIGENIPATLEWGPDKLLRIEVKQGGSGDFKMVKTDHNIDVNLRVIERCLGWIARTFHLNPLDMNLEGTAASGFALVIRKIPVLEDREDRLELFRGYERRLFECMRKVNNVRNPEGAISEELTLGIDFAEVEFPQDPMEKLNVTQKEIDMGLTSPIDEMLRRNPDLSSREEAEKKLLANLAERDRLKRQFNFSFGLGTGGQAPGAPAPTEPTPGTKPPTPPSEAARARTT